MKKLLAILLLASCLPALAESQVGSGSASARIMISITVLPSMNIQSITPVEGGLEYRGVTNMRNASLGGTYVTFDKPGPFVKIVPAVTNTATVDGLSSYEYVASP